MKRIHTRAALAVFALLFGVYLLTTGGHLYAIDEETMFALTESLALNGSFALNAGDSAAPPSYSIYGPAQSIAALPWYIAGRVLSQIWQPDAYEWLTRAAVSWFNPLVTAGVAALLVLAVGKLGFGVRVALGTALIYGLGTMAWPHSKTFFAEPLTALVLFGSFVLLLRAGSQEPEVRVQGSGVRNRTRARRSSAWGMSRGECFLLIVSGILAGMAPAIKIQAAIALPLLGLFALFESRTTHNHEAREEHEGHEGRQTNEQQYRTPSPRHLVTLSHTFRRALAWSLGAVLPLALLALYQNLAFGSPFSTGYGTVGTGFTTPFWEGFNGQIWSVGRGIIWYAPATLLFPVGLWMLRRRAPQVALLCLAMVVVHMLFYATWWAWHGAGAWGPRFLNAILPFFILPLAPLLASLRGKKLRQLMLVALAVLTVPVQLAGLLINLNAYFSLTSARSVDYFRPTDSAIVVHWGLIGNYTGRFYDRFFAPNSIALQSGVSYSEGGAAQVPRWTNAQATIGVRSNASAPTRLALTLSSCAAPLPISVQLTLDGRTLGAAFPACPARTLALALPPGNHTLTLGATPWNPAAFGSERDETLGVRIERLTAQAGDTSLMVRGDAFALTPMPTGHNAFRRWMTDHRSANWDFWWWYMQYTRFSTSNLLWLIVIWLAVGGTTLVIGLRGCVKLFTTKK